jgi:hypothetical protein
MHNLTRAADSRPPPTAEQLGCRIKVILVVLVSQPKITNGNLEHTARGEGLTLLRAAVLTLCHTTFVILVEKKNLAIFSYFHHSVGLVVLPFLFFFFDAV